MNKITVVLGTSILLQIAAAFLAWRLSWRYGGRWAWSLISLAVVLMAFRRCLTFYRVWAGDTSVVPDMSAELVALAISILMLCGIAFIDPVFRAITRAEEVLRGEKQQLAQLVEQRVVELKKEIAERQRAEETLTRYAQELELSQQQIKNQTRILQSVLDSLGDGVVVADERGRFILWNPRAAQIVGMGSMDVPLEKRPEIYGCYRPDQVTLFRPDDLPLVRALRGESADSVEMFIRNPRVPGGVWISSTARPLRDEEGGLKGGVVVFRDITQSKQAQEALRESEERTRTILESAHEAFITIDADGRVTDWNQQAQITFGWRREEVIGKPLAELIIPPQYREAHWRGLARFLSTGEGPVLGKLLELEALHRDGHSFPVELTISAIPRGATYMFSAFVRDITERKRAEQALTEYAQELARSNADLAQFAYVASHDLQEPLRMVTSYLQLLRRRYRGRLDSDADDFIDFSVDGATRMQAMIRDLLAYSLVGTQAKEFQLTDLNAVLKATLANLETAMADSRARVTWDALPQLMADHTQLVQVFQNLIGNAIKFRGADEPRIHVSAQEREEEWIISVRDNGIGMDPQHGERIFSIFQRLHGRGEYPGTGIGLAICKRIVERHGGRIWVESQPGEGSVFLFSLPKRS